MKRGFWASDWFAALVISIVIGMGAWAQSALLAGLERSAYDLGVRGSSRVPSDKIAVVAIDDESIANLGRWPWPRDIHAEMIDILSQGGAKVIGNLIFYSEPQRDPGLIYIQELRDLVKASPTRLPAVESKLEEAYRALDTDAVFAESLRRSENVVLPMTFVLGEPIGKPDEPLPDYLARNAIQQVQDRAGARGDFTLPAIAPGTPPIERIGRHATAIGHLNSVWDSDGGSRREPLVVRYYDQYYPSTALQIAARSLNLTPGDISINLGEGVELGGLSIRTNSFLEMHTFYYANDGERAAFPVDSFFDVISGKIPAEKYRGKIVLIGASAAGVGTVQKTPIAADIPPVVAMAHTVSAILEEDFFVVPEWAGMVELAAFVLVSAYLIVLFPRLRANAAAGITAALFVVLFGAEYFLMTTQATWIALMTSATLLVAGHALLTTKRFLMTERGKMKSEAESAESNRMLGLAHQGKGDLDMAFASFRKVPIDDSVMDLIYNLALDFERKRQFNKAVAAYQYIAEHDPKFRDVEQRMNRGKALEETVLLGAPGGGGGGPGATLLLDGGGVQKPMLGRYEVEKELGKGAMGIVYLGRDPKINRVVAIKTMALAQEFEEDELDEVKERFFREAETAGRLQHANIVTIYDAGEEHDLAFIAMEFLKGQDLAPFTKPDALLPLDKVVDIVIRSADALDYAHGENVVHRDIKPANIMYEADTGSVKLTDFGIARITDSSKTKTGMVLGTPSYMSPEQLAGKKVDGRSDLFSLGVMLFQLCTGVLPFKGDSMATLMFKIANEAHADISTIRTDVPECLKAIIDKALTKEANDRYSRGSEMARDLRACAAKLAA